MSSSEAQSKTKRAHCNHCLGERRQSILSETNWKDSELIGKGFDETIEWGASLFVLKCCGCDHINYLEEKWCNEDMDDRTGELLIRQHYYPNKILRKIPDRLNHLLLRSDSTLYRLLSETIQAFHDQQPMLTGMGLRAILDHMMSDILKSDETFQKKIAAMQSNHHISQRQADVLSRFTEIGHGAVHRGFVPTVEDLDILLDYTFGLLKTFYDFDSAISDIHKKVPPRPDKPAKHIPNESK